MQWAADYAFGNAQHDLIDPTFQTLSVFYAVLYQLA
jgi:hypothetical protein